MPEDNPDLTITETGLPLGVKRADGLDGRLGTASGVDQVLCTHSIGDGVDWLPLEELADSPQVEHGDRLTVTHRFRAWYYECLDWAVTIPRGTVIQEDDPFGLPNFYKVLSNSVQHEKGDTAILSVTLESMTSDTPPDRFAVTPVELGLNIIKHPRYFYAFLGEGYGSDTEQKNQMVIRLLQDYFENTTAAYRDALSQLLYCSLGTDGSTKGKKPQWNYGTETFPGGSKVTGTDMAKRAALEIIQKYWRGTETPYIVGWQLTWSAYYFYPQPLNPGGYVEDPAQASPAIPPMFYTVAPPGEVAGGVTMFEGMQWVNPQCYSDTGRLDGDLQMSWLRKADQIEYERTIYRVDRTWIGTPVGFWDPELYTRDEGPQKPDDYLLANMPACPGAP